MTWAPPDTVGGGERLGRGLGEQVDVDDWDAPTLDLDEPRRSRAHPPTHVDAFPAEDGTPLHDALIGAIRRKYFQLGWTQYRLAEECRTDRKTVQRLLYGQRCEMSTVERVMRVLGIERDVVESIYAARREEEWWRETPVTPTFVGVDEGLERLRFAGIRR